MRYRFTPVTITVAALVAVLWFCAWGWPVRITVMHHRQEAHPISFATVIQVGKRVKDSNSAKWVHRNALLSYKGPDGYTYTTWRGMPYNEHAEQREPIVLTSGGSFYAYHEPGSSGDDNPRHLDPAACWVAAVFGAAAVAWLAIWLLSLLAAKVPRVSRLVMAG